MYIRKDYWTPPPLFFKKVISIVVNFLFYYSISCMVDSSPLNDNHWSDCALEDNRSGAWYKMLNTIEALCDDIMYLIK